MQRYFLKLAYNGTDFNGWQIQPNAPSIQEEIINALTKMNRNNRVDVVGCGRTDAGVHASLFYAHFDFDPERLPKEVVFKLNNMLPNGIAIQECIPVKNEAHARFDATHRTYNYFIHTKKNPFRFQEAYLYSHELNVKAMNKASAQLLDFKDFTSFSKVHTENFTNDCNVSFAEWKVTEEGYQFTITANRFLRNMVRAIVGTSIEVGLGRMTIEEFKQIIELKDRSKAGRSVPGEGLFLADVSYPYL